MPNKLTNLELDALIIRIRDKSVKQLNIDLHNNLFSEKQIPYVEGYIQEKIKEERKAAINLQRTGKAQDVKIHDTWVYHALCDAKIVKSPVAQKLYKEGWTDSPAKVFNGYRGKWYKLIILYRKFKSWAIKNPNASIPLIVMAFIGIIGIGVTLLIHFTPNTTNQPKKETDAKANNE